MPSDRACRISRAKRLAPGVVVGIEQWLVEPITAPQIVQSALDIEHDLAEL